jgi:hypothetical protein
MQDKDWMNLHRIYPAGDYPTTCQPSRTLADIPPAINVMWPASMDSHGPVPDPVTGLVPCGEKRAKMWHADGRYWVTCGDISQTKYHETEEQAKVAWNTSHGYKENA